MLDPPYNMSPKGRATVFGVQDWKKLSSLIKEDGNFSKPKLMVPRLNIPQQDGKDLCTNKENEHL